MTACAVCRTEQPAGQTFCGECGARLTTGSRERKVVTVLFCDLVGHTAASDGQDPEEIQARLAPYHACCRTVIRRFGGTFEKFIGDAVMAVFGAPAAHEDDPERAVRAGLALLDAVHELDQGPGAGLDVHIGVATGEAVVLLDARPDLGELVVAGDVVNVAARLQSAAPPGRILVNTTTWDRSRARIEYEAHEAVRVKGKSGALPVWLVLGSRGSVGDELADTSRPMVGRSGELRTLKRAFNRAIRTRSSQVITVEAEPGLGKSRLVQAFRDWVAAREDLIVWRQGRTPPYGEAVALSALVQILRAHTGVLASDPVDVALGKLTTTVEDVVAGTDMADQWPWLTDRLATLLGLPAVEAPREELFTAWARFLEAVASRSPLVIVVEDLHWADRALVDFLLHLGSPPRPVPITVVLTTRPDLRERSAAWFEPRRGFTTVTLGSLSDAEIAQLVADQVGPDVLPPDRHAALLAGAAGNPLYAREYLRWLTADQAAVESEPVPTSVRAVIAARLDTLGARRKSLLLSASVIGHTFWTDAVASLVGIGAQDVEQRLDRLVERDFLRRSGSSRFGGQVEYSFTHGLIAEVAHARLPHLDRARLHESAATWHQGWITDPETSPDSALVSHHYEQAHRWAASRHAPAAELARLAELSASWHTPAAEQARHRDGAAALSHARAAVRFTLDEAPAQGRRLLVLGELLWAHGENQAAAEQLQQAESVADHTGDELLAASARLRRAAVLVDLGSAAEAAALRDSAIAALTRQPPGPELVDAYLLLARDTAFNGDMRGATAAVNTGLEVLDQIEAPPPRLRVRALELRGSQRSWSGDPGGIDDLTRALELAQLGVMTDATIGIHHELASYHYFATSISVAITHDEDALALAQQCSHLTWSLLLAGALAEVLVMAGRIEEASRRCDEAADRCRGVQHLIGWATLQASRARALSLAGHPDAVAVVAEAVATARETSAGILAGSLLVAAEHELATTGALGASGLELLDLLEDPRVRELQAQYLSRTSRLAVAAGRPELLEEWVQGYPRGMSLFDHNLLALRALQAERRGDDQGALSLHREAARVWSGYGCRLEEAHALVAAGACSRRLGLADDDGRHGVALLDEIGADASARAWSGAV